MTSCKEALRNRHMHAAKRLSEHICPHPPLTVRDCIQIQNQVRPNPTKWDKTSVIIEVHQFNQYVLRVDGSGRVTLHNRKFLQKYLPVVPHAPLLTDPGPSAFLTPTPMTKLPSQPSLTAPHAATPPRPQAYPTCPFPNTKTTTTGNPFTLPTHRAKSTPPTFTTSRCSTNGCTPRTLQAL
uniref:Uncharacterized protein n=1 Tax=Octopus bimaculoides TaxID=37653 RepID=A0A0L8FUD1_OCTBM